MNDSSVSNVMVETQPQQSQPPQQQQTREVCVVTSGSESEGEHEHHEHDSASSVSTAGPPMDALSSVTSSSTMTQITAAKQTTKPKTARGEKRRVVHDYHDHAMDSMEICEQEQQIIQAAAVTAPVAPKRRGPRGGVTVPFPDKLHQMLMKVEQDGLSGIVSWAPHGRAFKVHQTKEFVRDIMPTYFRQSKLTSFQRQLNLYGFCRLTSGRDRGGYYHELFLRGKPHLCKRMIRTRIKGTGIKAASNPQKEPDFYNMSYVDGEEGSALTSPMDLDALTQPTTEAVAPARAPSPAVAPMAATSRAVATAEVSPVMQPQQPTSIVMVPSMHVVTSEVAPASAPGSSQLTTATIPAMQFVNATEVAAAPASLTVSAPGDGGNMITPPATPTVTVLTASSSHLATIPSFPILSKQATATAAATAAALAEPCQDDLIMFEGQHFHYLDPSTFDFSAAMSTTGDATVPTPDQVTTMGSDSTISFVALPETAISNQTMVFSPTTPEQIPSSISTHGTYNVPLVMVASSSESSLTASKEQQHLQALAAV